jgi:PKD repeat protein
VNNSETFTNNSLGAISYLWNFGDTTSPDISQNPVHNYNYAGTYTVTLISSNGNCSDSSHKTIVVVDSLNANLTSVVSQDQNSSSVNVIYDQGEIYLAFGLPDAEDVCISVYNLIGEKIYSENVFHVQENRIKLNLENIPSGIYIAVARMPDAVISKKILFNGR